MTPNPLSLSGVGRMRGALATLEKLVQIFPEDMALKNDLGVAHLLIGDNNSAKRVYEEVRQRRHHIGETMCRKWIAIVLHIFTHVCASANTIEM